LTDCSWKVISYSIYALLQKRLKAKSLELPLDKPHYEGLKLSREEYLDLEEDGFKYDMIEGVLHLAPSGEFEHAEFQIWFVKFFLLAQ
jgi:hypothetical protein